ncbi:peptidoglycan-binding protein [Nocardioides sp.]|uniref:peptidoglycan-binding protein n=1 Tax=Nocardioides sp. TaxID=35761 RepID=UPI00260A9489|nr:peptidoglycan-binding protein [Nocardioides sp.]MDI6909418.1 peptidoglycan-binding protein [Nocardioides sp.]
MLLTRRLLLLVAVAALLCGAAFVAGDALDGAPATRPAAAGPGAAPTAQPTSPAATPSGTPTTAPTSSAPTRTATSTPTGAPTGEPTREPTREPTLEPGPRLVGPGDQGDEVRDLQARLKQIYWFNADVTGVYGDVTATAVRGFQAKREIPVTGEVDQRTLDRLYAMTSTPTDAELHNRGNTPGALDPRCRTGRVLCIDKTSSTLRWVVDGAVRQTLDVRFGASSTPTREGVFHVYVKDADHVSRLYGSAMPYSMFFSGGQAVHYSSDFAAVGYAGASHGCVNVRDYDGLGQLYAQVRVGDTVVVYWS